MKGACGGGCATCPGMRTWRWGESPNLLEDNMQRSVTETLILERKTYEINVVDGILNMWWVNLDEVAVLKGKWRRENGEVKLDILHIDSDNAPSDLHQLLKTVKAIVGA
jgi:hypothetical protein